MLHCRLSASQYLWEDDSGTVHTIDQGEGGEQGNASMPLLYSHGQHGALQKLHSELRDEETLLAFWMTRMWSFCIWTGRQQSTQRCRRQCSAQQAFAPTQRRRRSGTQQGQIVMMWRVAAHCRDLRSHSGGVEDPSCPTHRQEFNVLGTPLGHPDFVRTSLEMKNISHKCFLDKISFWKTCKLLGCWSIVQLFEPTA